MCRNDIIKSIRHRDTSLGPTGLVGLHYGLVDVIVGDVSVSVGLLPLVQLLLNGPQCIVDLGGRGVRQIRCSLCFMDLSTKICSPEKKQNKN